MRKMIVSVFPLLFLLSFTVAFAQERAVLQDEAAQADWREDVQAMVERMERIHPNLFWRVSEADFRQQVDDFAAEIPYLTDDQIIMGLARIVALIDGHTHLGLLQPAVGFHVYPLHLYWFSDGLFVIDAEDQSIIGARVISIGGTDIDDVDARITPLVQHDNGMSTLHLSPAFITMPEVLIGLGIIEDADQPNFVLERQNGEQFSLNLTPVETDGLPFQEWYLVGLPQQQGPFYLLHRYEKFWFTFLEESQTFYIQYNEVQRQTESGSTILEFSREIETFVEENDVERVVVDLRT